MSNFIKSYQANVGLNHVPAYQVSGQPFATGSIDATGGAVVVRFPYVTRWVNIINHDTNELTCSFSEAGLSGDNHFNRRLIILCDLLCRWVPHNQTTARPEAAPERKFMAPGIKQPNAKAQSSPYL